MEFILEMFMTNTIFSSVALFLCILSQPTTSYADCAKDYIGNVYCAAQPLGGAKVDSIGNVQCGKGQCRQDSIGNVYCSKVAGGGAEKDSIGVVRCLGGCDQASQSMCVRGES